MLYRLVNSHDVYNHADKLREDVFTEILRGTVFLDSEHGEDRDLNVGGYTVVIDSVEDLDALKSIINYDTLPCEWVTNIGKSSYISALFIPNNDFSLMVFMPKSIAPQSILTELEN